LSTKFKGKQNVSEVAIVKIKILTLKKVTYITFMYVPIWISLKVTPKLKGKLFVNPKLNFQLIFE